MTGVKATGTSSDNCDNGNCIVRACVLRQRVREKKTVETQQSFGFALERQQPLHSPGILPPLSNTQQVTTMTNLFLTNKQACKLSSQQQPHHKLCNHLRASWSPMMQARSRLQKGSRRLRLICTTGRSMSTLLSYLLVSVTATDSEHMAAFVLTLRQTPSFSCSRRLRSGAD